MSHFDDIIRRWLDEASDDAPPRLEREGESDSVEAESKMLRDRLRIVQGLLSTLDRRSAPEELDNWLASEPAQGLSSDSVESREVDLSDWLVVPGGEGLFQPKKAPEFLDRIVEQRLAGLEPDRSLQSKSDSPWTTSRRLWAGAAFATALLIAPFFLGSDAGQEPVPVRLVSYNSLEGLQKAFPAQSQVARSMGILGAFGVPGDPSGGLR